MAFSINYYFSARNDIKKAKEWYKDKQDGLEKRFAASVKATILKVQENPLSYSPYYTNVRVAYTKIFPFGIYFTVDEDINQIIIIAILHNKRDKTTLLKSILE